VAALRRQLPMSNTAAAVTRSVAAAEDIGTPLATSAVDSRGIGFRKLQMVHRGAALAHVPRARVWNSARYGVMRATVESFQSTNLSAVV
jgi:hypothetical protein